MCFLPAFSITAFSVETESIHVQFVTAGATDVEWDFPYSDSLFLNDPSVYDHTAAKASLGLALSSVRNSRYEYRDQNTTVKKYLTDTGFSNLSFEQYDIEPRIDTVATAIGSKQIDDFTLIALITCGDGYGKEWGSNLTIGTGERHAGFDRSAQIVEKRLTDYIKDNNITGKTKLWISGFSRAAAIDNLVAADMNESGIFSDIYAYLFACPLNTKSPKPYDNIFNIVGKNDPINSIPFRDWGFGRNGRTFYISAEQYDSSWYEGAKSVTKVALSFYGDYYRNNPALDYKIRTVLELLYNIYPTQESYAKYLEPTATALFKNFSGTDLVLLLFEAVTERSKKNARDEGGVIYDEDDEAIDLFLDYSASAFSEYLKGGSPEVADGSWQEGLSPDMNVFHEHSQEVYVEWMCADISEEKLYGTGDEYLRMEISGPVTVRIERGMDECAVIKEDGTLTYNAETGKDITLPEPFAVRNNGSTVMEIPLDCDYHIFIQAEEKGRIDCTAAYYLLERTAGYRTWQFELTADKNQSFLIPLDLDEDGRLIPEFTDAQNLRVLGNSRAERKLALKLENSNIPIVSIRTIMKGVLIGIICFLLLVILSVAQFIYIRVKKISPPEHARKINRVLMTVMGLIFAASAIFYALL